MPAQLPFAILPGYLALEANPTALKIYAALALRVDHRTGLCYPTHAQIAEDTGVSTRTVIRALNELIRLGAIERNHRVNEAGDQTSNLYRLPFAVNRRARGVTPVTLPRDNGDMTPVTDLSHKLDSIELEARAEYDNDDFQAWAEARSVKRGGGPGLLAKILAEDRHLWEAEQRQTKAGGTNPSPPRNPPEACQHRALDVDGWCAACMTQIEMALDK